MSYAKYSKITVDLEEKIKQEVYKKKLPSTRELASRYNVSKQTITNALKPLLQKGIITSEGRRGVLIKQIKHEQGLICIVATGELSLLNNDKDLSALQEKIRQDGFDVMLISSDSQHVNTSRMCRLLESSFDGIIFTNSTLSVEVAEFLTEKDIPFVSCNRLPICPNLNWVEHDWKTPIRELATNFAHSGYTRQALFFPGRLESYNYLIRKEWNKIKSDLNIPSLPIDNTIIDYTKTPVEFLRHYLMHLKKTGVYPEVLIIWGQIVLDELCDGPYKLPNECLIVGSLSDANGIKELPDNVKLFSPANYCDLMLHAYKALREIMLAPNKKLIHRFIENPISWHQEPPFEKKLKEKVI